MTIDTDKKRFTVAVFCGSNPGSNPAYMDAATKLGHICHNKGWNVVYGGGTTGIMGQVASTLVSLSGKDSVHGVIPSTLFSMEQSSAGAQSMDLYGHMTIVPDMHTRKRLMAQEADAFIALPGGYGTAEELFEVITWNQLGIHERPIVLVNVDGFYDGLVMWVDRATEEGFVTESCRGIITVAVDVDEVVGLIENYEVPEGRYDLTWGSE